MNVKCTHCGKEFGVWQSKYNKAVEKFNGHLYCCKQCYIDHQVPLYEKFYWCNRCKWIPKSSVTTKKKGTKNHYRYSKNIYLERIGASPQPLLFLNYTQMIKKVNADDIITKTPRYSIYTLKRDQLYCSRCNELIDMRKNERMIRRSRQKRLKIEVPRIE